MARIAEWPRREKVHAGHAGSAAMLRLTALLSSSSYVTEREREGDRERERASEREGGRG